MNVFAFDLELILVLTITNLVCRVIMATLLGFYTIVEIPLSLLVSFGILNLTVKNDQGETTSEGKQEDKTSEMEKSGHTKSETHHTENLEDKTSNGNETEETKVIFENEKHPPLQEAGLPRNIGVDSTANSASIGENVVEAIKDTKEPEACTTENKEKKESFLWTASICSLFTPAVVGDWKKKIFLKTGVTSLVLRSTAVIVAILLSILGYNINPRPNLIWCLQESSPLIDQNSNVTYCIFGNDNSNWTSCSPDVSNYTGLTDFADSLEQLEDAVLAVKKKADKVKESKIQEHLYLVDQVYSLKSQIAHHKEAVTKTLRSVGLQGLVQKVRICDKTSENKIRLGIFVGLSLLIVLAALATYRLHRISDFKAGFINFLCNDLLN